MGNQSTPDASPQYQPQGIPQQAPPQGMPMQAQTQPMPSPPQGMPMQGPPGGMPMQRPPMPPQGMPMQGPPQGMPPQAQGQGRPQFAGQPAAPSQGGDVGKQREMAQQIRGNRGRR